MDVSEYPLEIEQVNEKLNHLKIEIDSNFKN